MVSRKHEIKTVSLIGRGRTFKSGPKKKKAVIAAGFFGIRENELLRVTHKSLSRRILQEAVHLRDL